MGEDGMIGQRNGNEYTIKDDAPILEFYLAHKDDDNKTLAHAVCSNTDFWGEDLSLVSGFEAEVAKYLDMIDEKGTYEVMKSCL